MPEANALYIYFTRGDEFPARDLRRSLEDSGVLLPVEHRLLYPGTIGRARPQVTVLFLGPGPLEASAQEAISIVAKLSMLTIVAVPRESSVPKLQNPAEIIFYDFSLAGVKELARHITRLLFARKLINRTNFSATSIAALPKSLRSLNLPNYVVARLEAADITRIGELVEHSEAEILRIPLIGRETLLLLRRTLGALGLRLGMDLPDWRSTVEFESEGHLPAARLASIEQEPLGARFEAESENLVIDDAGAATDDEAAKSAIVEQLHREVTRKTKDLQPALVRLDNQLGWHGIARACERLTRCLDRDTLELPAHLGALYSASLEMGSFLDLDRNVREDASASGLPLELELRRPLEDLVRTLAPWLRSFPSIRELDEQLSQFTAPNPLVAPAGEVIGRASDAHLVRNEDYQLLLGLVEAAGRGRVQGSKASHRGVLSARNLIIATAKLISVLSLGALGSDIATKSVLVQRTGTFLMSAERPIMEVISGLPSDVQLAVEALLRDAKGPTPLVPQQPKETSLNAQTVSRRRRDEE